MKLLTASKASLALRCKYWLQDEVELPGDKGSPAADFGTAVHQGIEAGETDSSDPEVRKQVARALEYMAALKPLPMSQEDAFGFRGTTAVHVGTGRDSYAGHGQRGGALVAGTTDLLVRLSPGRWKVVDWKTGNPYKAEHQLRTLAALVLLANDGDSCEMTAFCTKTGEEVTYGELDGMDAHGWLGSLLEGHRDPTPGEHCAEMYCPLKGKCPAYTQAAELVPAAELVRGRRNPLVTGIKDAADAALAYELKTFVEARLAAMMEELKDFVAVNGEVPLADGRTYKAFDQTRTTTNAEKALALAEKCGASPEELSDCVKVSTFQVFKAVGKKGV